MNPSSSKAGTVCCGFIFTEMAKSRDKKKGVISDIFLQERSLKKKKETAYLLILWRERFVFVGVDLFESELQAQSPGQESHAGGKGAQLLVVQDYAHFAFLWDSIDTWGSFFFILFFTFRYFALKSGSWTWELALFGNA